jgi:putative ATP-dependent endonuclease of OLD family
MFISSLRASGYRNLDTTIGLCSPLAVIVGENNAGKSNVIDALRTVLEPEVGPRGRCWVHRDDFGHGGLGRDPLSRELELEVRLEGLSVEEQARMVTCRAPKEGKGVAKIRFKAVLGADDRVRGQWFGGDSEQPEIDRYAREALRFVYLHPLRDAAADLRPGRDNKLIGLLNALTPDDHPDRAKIVAASQAANDALEGIDAITQAKSHIAGRLSGMTGRGRFSQHSGLAFEDPRFDRIVGALRAKIGELAALEMAENGLGYNNLLYMAVLLAAMAGPGAEASEAEGEDQDEEQTEPNLRVLLVEEPEAHLHPQLQDLLMRFLQREAGDGTQVILSTHSPNFASSAEVERLTVLTRRQGKPEAVLPRDFGLEDKQLAYLRRFLDVTKASLFFARGVILVEGVAEQLLIPVLAERMGRALAPNGVTVINVGGVAFPPFTDLFGDGRLPYPVAVVSDSDAQPDPEGLEDGDPALSPRAADLAGRAEANLSVHLAPRTLEFDLCAVGNAEIMIEALTQVKPRVGPRVAREIEGLAPAEAAEKVLEAVKDVKGRFAQELAELIAADPKREFHIPDYLREAIEAVADTVEPDPLPADGEADVSDA